jgi:hypothetical protein
MRTSYALAILLSFIGSVAQAQSVTDVELGDAAVRCQQAKRREMQVPITAEVKASCDAIAAERQRRFLANRKAQQDDDHAKLSDVVKRLSK